MPRPSGGYFLADGTRVPSVTTVISRFKDAGALMAWAWKEAKAGRDYRETRDAAASAGTLAHQAVDMWIHGRPMVWPEDGAVVDRAQKAFGAFREWADQTQLRVTHTEQALVSPMWRVGGTFDALLVKERRAMGDWKTAAALYPDMLLQVAAYGKLWDEHHPDDPITGGYHILRFDKEYGDFHAHWWAELDTAWRAFLILRELYDLEKELKARAK